MAKGPSEFAVDAMECQEDAGETGELWPSLDEARARVLSIQTKLHQWLTDDPGRRFDDLFNLVADPAFLLVAWDRVRGNRGARSAEVDGIVPRSVVFGDLMLHGLRAQLKTRSFEPLPVKERLIPKASGKFRRLGSLLFGTGSCKPA